MTPGNNFLCHIKPINFCLIITAQKRCFSKYPCMEKRFANTCTTAYKISLLSVANHINWGIHKQRVDTTAGNSFLMTLPKHAKISATHSVLIQNVNIYSNDKCTAFHIYIENDFF